MSYLLLSLMVMTFFAQNSARPGLKPLPAADVVPGPDPRVQGEGLAGEPLLPGVGVCQRHGQVEQPGIPIPPPGNTEKINLEIVTRPGGIELIE